MGIISKILGTSKPEIGPDGKVDCKICGAKILPHTYKKNDGLCVPCKRKEENPLKEKLEDVPKIFGSSMPERRSALSPRARVESAVNCPISPQGVSPDQL